MEDADIDYFYWNLVGARSLDDRTSLLDDALKRLSDVTPMNSYSACDWEIASGEQIEYHDAIKERADKYINDVYTNNAVLKLRSHTSSILFNHALEMESSSLRNAHESLESANFGNFTAFADFSTPTTFEPLKKTVAEEPVEEKKNGEEEESPEVNETQQNEAAKNEFSEPTPEVIVVVGEHNLDELGDGKNAENENEETDTTNETLSDNNAEEELPKPEEPPRELTEEEKARMALFASFEEVLQTDNKEQQQDKEEEQQYDSNKTKEESEQFDFYNSEKELRRRRVAEEVLAKTTSNPNPIAQAAFNAPIKRTVDLANLAQIDIDSLVGLNVVQEEMTTVSTTHYSRYAGVNQARSNSINHDDIDITDRDGAFKAFEIPEIPELAASIEKKQEIKVQKKKIDSNGSVAVSQTFEMKRKSAVQAPESVNIVMPFEKPPETVGTPKPSTNPFNDFFALNAKTQNTKQSNLGAQQSFTELFRSETVFPSTIQANTNKKPLENLFDVITFDDKVASNTENSVSLMSVESTQNMDTSFAADFSGIGKSESLKNLFEETTVAKTIQNSNVVKDNNKSAPVASEINFAAFPAPAPAAPHTPNFAAFPAFTAPVPASVQAAPVIVPQESKFVPSFDSAFNNSSSKNQKNTSAKPQTGVNTFEFGAFSDDGPVLAPSIKNKEPTISSVKNEPVFNADFGDFGSFQTKNSNVPSEAFDTDFGDTTFPKQDTPNVEVSSQSAPKTVEFAAFPSIQTGIQQPTIITSSASAQPLPGSFNVASIIKTGPRETIDPFKTVFDPNNVRIQVQETVSPADLLDF